MSHADGRHRRRCSRREHPLPNPPPLRGRGSAELPLPRSGGGSGRGHRHMTAAPIHLAGERLMLDPAGALFWPATALLAVSDLHLEKGSSYARHGHLLPPWDTQATLDRLTLLLRRYRPRLVIALGDSFHDADGATRLPSGELSRLRAMTEAHRFIWVRGNHDPSPPQGLAGESVDAFTTATLAFRHQ